MDDREWLEADGLGGFASGTASRVRTRRYHALLLSALRPPADRIVLVSDLEAWVVTDGGRFGITPQHYAPGVLHPAEPQSTFSSEPWPTWRIRLADGTEIEHSIVVPRGHAT